MKRLLLISLLNIGLSENENVDNKALEYILKQWI